MATPLRVLLVEDSAADAALLLRCLKKAGYDPTAERVETAESMRAALARTRFDIVLSDHRMPLFSALGALSVLREGGLDLPFIIVSGNIGEELVAAAMKDGASDYVLKDDLSRIGPAIERALREAAARIEHRRAVDALSESEERFALAVRGSRDGLWDYSLLTGAIYFSTRFKEMLGYEEHELASLQEVAARIHEDDRDRAVSALRDHLERRLPLDVEIRGVTRQGECRWFSLRGQALWDERGQATRVAGSMSDLTARKSVEMELTRQLEIVRQQKEAIRVLSAPIIDVWDGVLTVPVLGELDRERAQAILDTLLAAVSRSRCRRVILDVTGVPSMDAATAERLVQIVRAVRLLGAEGIVVGIQPPVANAIVALGLDLSSITTLANLREALKRCMSAQGREPGGRTSRSA